MKDKIIILSDIHGNLSALNAVMRDVESKDYRPDALVILGDNINYGMRSNEVISTLKGISNKYKVIINLYGNHEKAIMDGDTTHFSTERGKKILDFTRNILTEDSIRYIVQLTEEGTKDLMICNKRFLFVHGNISDPYWGKLNCETLNDYRYSSYDYVISGHTHIPQMTEHFFTMENPEYRNKKRTIFLNPGSVGQPRNHNPRAQYLYMEICAEIFHFNSVCYDIESERVLFNNEVDRFYSDRLINGI